MHIHLTESCLQDRVSDQRNDQLGKQTYLKDYTQRCSAHSCLLCTITDFLVRQHKRYTVTIQTNFYIVQVLLLCRFGPFLGHDLPKYQDFEIIIFMGDVSLKPNPQPGGPVYLFGTFLKTCPAWWLCSR
jgi:hypothetical protein